MCVTALVVCLAAGRAEAADNLPLWQPSGCTAPESTKVTRFREGGKRVDVYLGPCVSKDVGQRILRLFRLHAFANGQPSFANGRVPEVPSVDYSRITAIRQTRNEASDLRAAEYEVQTAWGPRTQGMFIGVCLSDGEPRLVWASAWIVMTVSLGLDCANVH